MYVLISNYKILIPVWTGETSRYKIYLKKVFLTEPDLNIYLGG